MKVLLFTGMPGSGKSEAMSVVNALGIPVYRMGDDIWDEVRSRNLPLTSPNVGAIATQMRKEHGEQIWAERTLRRIDANRTTAASAAAAAGKPKPDEPPVVAIDGTRSQAEIDCFRTALGTDLVVVAIHSSSRARHDRLRHRGRADDSSESGAISDRDRRELGWGIAEAIALADVHLANDGSLDMFHARVRALLEAFLAGHEPHRAAPQPPR